MTILEKSLRAVVLAGVFVLPFVCLIVTSSLFFPYITGKNFTFRIIVEVIAGAWLALALVYPKYRPRRNWILGAFALFVLIIAIADAQGANPFKSFWSNFERMDGWVTIAHTLVYLVVAAAVLQSEKLWQRLFQVSLAVSAYVSIYGLLQVAGTLALGQNGAGGLSARVDATFGNPIYLAVYMLFHVFIAAMLWAQSKKENGKYKTLLSWLYGIIIVLDTLTLFLTGTRGTMIGLVGGALLSLLIFTLASGSKRVRVVAICSLLLIVVLGGAIKLGRNTPLVQQVGFLERLSSISLTDQTIASRFTNMSIAWQGVKERPLLGWGQENYAIVFDKYYDPRMYINEPWFDRVHNIIFDWLIAGGFLGLISYLSIFAAALWLVWRKISNFSMAEKSIFTGLFAGYFFHNLTVFDNVTSYILFATTLAYIVWRADTASKSSLIVERNIVPESTLPFFAVGAIVLVWALAWWVNATALAQNRTLISAISQHTALSENLALFKQATAYGSYGTQEAREQLAQGASQVAGSQSIDIATKQQFFDLAVQQMTLQEQASPLDARFPLFLGTLQYAYGDYADAANAFEKAHELSPKKQTILYEIALLQQTQSNYTGALQTLKTAYELETSNVNARIYYAAAAIPLGQISLVDQLLAPIIPTGEAADPRILSAYANQKRWDKLIPIWQAHVKAVPTDIQGYFTLAAIYYQGGNPAQAILSLQQAESLSPSVAAQAEGLIQQIRQGTLKVQ